MAGLYPPLKPLPVPRPPEPEPRPAAANVAAVESERLRYRDFTEGDIPLLARWMADPQMMKNMRTPAALDDTAARVFVAWQMSRAAAGRPHFRIIERREDGIVVGHCGLKRLDDWPREQSSLEADAELEVGYMLDPKWWGHGYATEAALSALADGFNNFGRDRIFARANPENAASVAVMKRCGMALDREDLEDGRRFVRYQITRPQWESRLTSR